MKRPKSMFGLTVDLRQIPGYRARFGSVDKFGNIIDIKMDSVDIKPALDAEPNLAAKLQSGQDIRSNPGIILRRKGIVT